MADEAISARSELPAAIIVLGEAGHGKTTLTAAIARITTAAPPGDRDDAPVETVATSGTAAPASTPIDFATATRGYRQVDYATYDDCAKALLIGATRIDGAILVVSPIEGPTGRTRELLMLARLAGISRLVIFVSKADLIGHAARRESIEKSVRLMLAQCGFDGEGTPLIFGSARAALAGESSTTGIGAILALLDAMDRWIEPRESPAAAAPEATGTSAVFPAFTAQAYFLSTAEGGRDEAIATGYRADFAFGSRSVAGAITLPPGVDTVAPGDLSEIGVTLTVSVSIARGLPFDVREGERRIGFGVVSVVDALPRAEPAAAGAPTPPPPFRNFAQVTAPIQLDDPGKRAGWGLPAVGSPDRGSYIFELNAQHGGGLTGAEMDFRLLYTEIVRGEERPVRIAKSYFQCLVTDHEWRRLIAADERKPRREQAVYRIWPDFPVHARTDRSVATVKADAAFNAFGAGGDNIVWAVIDSGIQADHCHFGPSGDDDDAAEAKHLLRNEDVRDLHRCFAELFERKGDLLVSSGRLPELDGDDGLSADDHAALLKRHRTYALIDDFGHGTHVAGIIAGEAPAKADGIWVIEKQLKSDPDGKKIGEYYEKRELKRNARLRGMAPFCKLISLRVLDYQGRGRASQVIQALEYIRERINDNPKVLRVHGVNLSVGYEFDPEMFACGQSPLCTSVDRLVQEGVVVVTAAGNTGFGTAASSAGSAQIGLSNTINDPGNAALAITVGSTHRDSPHMFGVSYFSSKGPTADGRSKPDLVAPGERITSCAVGRKLAAAGSVVADGLRLATYIDDTGTSMAAPHVSGAVAAFLSIRREFIGRPLEVKRIFMESATSLGRERYFEGRGLLDLMRAIQSV